MLAENVPHDEDESSDGLTDDSADEPEKQEQNKWAEFGLSEQSFGNFVDIVGGESRGKIHVAKEETLTATCRSHKRCTCWFSKVAVISGGERALVEWFAHGRTTTMEQHQDLARELKIQHGMRVRKK